MGVTFLEFVPNPLEGWPAIGPGLLTALAAGAILRLGDFRVALRIVLSVNVGAGVVFALGVIAGPPLLRGLWNLGKRTLLS